MDTVYIIFLFLLGASLGSFINVVAWRYPTGGWKALLWPPSQCPKCNHRLAAFDNIPVFGWIMLRGRCRYCKAPISIRYPIFEFLSGAILVFYYVIFFMMHLGPCAPQPAATWDSLFGRVVLSDRMPTDIMQDWPIYSLYMFMLLGLLTASLIDAEFFIIPPEIPWATAIVAFIMHGLFDRPDMAGSLNMVGKMLPITAAAVGGAAGLALSMILWCLGIMPTTFPKGEPVEELDKDEFEAELKEARAKGLPDPEPPPVMTKAQVRAEIRKEILFLMPALLGAAGFLIATWKLPAVNAWWTPIAGQRWISAVLGSMLGAMVGALVVWSARIFGTLGLGRLAMGLGDVHLMFGVGAVIGAGGATLAFFLSPFAAIAFGLYRLITKQRHEMPLGPYLSLATALVVIFYCPIARHFEPGFIGLMQFANDLINGR